MIVSAQVTRHGAFRALGMARRATRRARTKRRLHLGDARADQCISFEALNNISHTTKKFIGILNDNEWSIAKTWRNFAYLNKLITSPA